VAERQQAELTGEQEEPRRTLRVGLLQTAPVFGQIDGNLADIAELHGRLGSADLSFTAELSATGYGFSPHRPCDTLAVDDPRLTTLTKKGIGIGFAERNHAGLPWNSYLLTDPATGTQHLQRKLHPVSYAPWNEHLLFQPGDALRTAAVQHTRIATVICNDMWHPAGPWLAFHAGAEVLIVPVASIESDDAARIKRTWQLILEHAAVLLQCYVVFINRSGTDSGKRFWGGSRVLNPDGSVLTSLGDEPGATVAELDLAALRRLRAEVPLLSESRSDLVAAALSGGPHPESN
jgi:predicted amidohydrolase